MHSANNQKIIPFKDLAKISASLKQAGKTIAHCHGCFDLLHPGHMKHFESAARIADVLVVTLTQDKFVNKGPGRPVFTEQVRAEAIAALQCVDYVCINNFPTAIEPIGQLRPDFYVKGPDYKDQSKDLTNNISREEEAVKSAGGQLFITDDITFSSSKLINSHFSQLSDQVQRFLEDFKQRFTVDQVISEIDRLSKLKILVIGDTIIDEYHTCTPLGKSSKSPTISTIYRSGVSYAGGVLAIANHLDQYAERVEMMTVLGTENPQQELIESKLSPSVKPHFFYRNDGPTNTKRRYLDTYLNLKLFEVTFMNDKHIDSELEAAIIKQLEATIDQVDLVMVADFGHGLITPNIIRFLEQSGKYLCINAQTNSNNFGFNYITKYRRCNYISIDEKELRLPFGDAYGSIESLVKELASISNCPLIQITLGASGSMFYKDGKSFHTPAFATSVKDSVGAGDAVLSITSLLAYQETPVEIIGLVGNCTGSLAVNILGNEHPVYKKDLTKFISHFIK
ncbi:MAG: PfkB family carbohydrate kinase [Chitinophagales bacterium]